MKIAKIITILSLLSTFLYSSDNYSPQETVFRTYCWGCHHQTATAFGPSFKQIAQTRTKDQMMTHIMSPSSDYKQLGYKRSVMPSFGNTLSTKELNYIVDYIISCKDKK